jgi:subtilase family serine protease
MSITKIGRALGGTSRRSLGGPVSAVRWIDSSGTIELLESRVLLSASLAHKQPVHQVRHIPAVHPAPVTHHVSKNGIHTTLVPTKRGAKPLQSASPPATAISPLAVRHAYGIDNISFSGIVGDGTGQTIVLVDAYDDPGLVDTSDIADFPTSDLAMFDAQYGLPNPPSFTKLDQYGGTNYPAYDQNWSIEEALDVEWSHAMAPMANIILVEANSADLQDLVGNPFTNTTGAVPMAASLPGVSAISMSWGEGEFSSEDYYDSFFTTPAGHTGITYLAATGDTGSPGYYPAYSPNVVAVGGTSLTLTGNNNYSSESAWSVGANASGGGISGYEAKPSYQSGVTQVPATPSQTVPVSMRAIPDVSLVASNSPGMPVYDSTAFGGSTPWAAYGGTSFASPMWAGLIAIADQGRALNGQSSLDGPSQTLPALYAASSSDFNDITTGNNHVSGNSGYYAGPGYDAVTGIGTPIANKLIPDLAGLPQSPITNLYYKQAGSNLDIWVNSTSPGLGTPTEQFVLADASGVLFCPAAGNDTLALDYSAGNFASAWTSIKYTGATGGSNAIDFIGTLASDILTVTGTGITPSGGFGSTPITVLNVGTIQLAGGSGGNDAINVIGSPAGGYTINADTPTGTANVAVNVTGASTAINFACTQHLAALSISSGDTATLSSSASSGGKLLITASLSVLGSGILNLANNVMVVQGGSLAAITSLLTTGFAGGYWNGYGINSSAAASDTTFRTALGVISNSNNGIPIYPVFDGYAASASDIFVKYTYYGDADLNGVVNGADYQLIDVGFHTGQGNWMNGNFNYDSSIDGSDFTLIDNDYNEQGLPL